MKRGTERIAWIDIAKALGIACIVLGHTLQGTGFLRQYTYAFSVPFFFFLMGVTYHTKPAREFYSEKFHRVVIPYITFAIVSIIIFKVFEKLVGTIDSTASTDILPNLLGALYANSRTDFMKWNVPLWFLPCMLGTSCIVDVWERCFLRQKTTCINRSRGLFAFAAAAVFYFITKYCPKLMLPLQLETAFLMAAFMELGILFAHSALFQKILKEKSLRIFVLPTLIGLTAGGVICYLNGYADIRIHRYGASLLLYLCGAVLICTGAVSLSVLLSKIKGNGSFLSYIGQHTMGILLMHKFPIVVFQSLIPFSSSLLTHQSGTLRGMLWACLVSAIVIFMCLSAERIVGPLFPWAFGNKK